MVKKEQENEYNNLLFLYMFTKTKKLLHIMKATPIKRIEKCITTIQTT